MQKQGGGDRAGGDTAVRVIGSSRSVVEVEGAKYPGPRDPSSNLENSRKRNISWDQPG